MVEKITSTNTDVGDEKYKGSEELLAMIMLGNKKGASDAAAQIPGTFDRNLIHTFCASIEELMRPGKPEKYDYKYVRNGKLNIFIAVEFKAGKLVKRVTERRTMNDFASFVKMLVDKEYPDEVNVIRLVADNLNTHKEKTFYEMFSKGEAERILSNIELHFTPNHASWFNDAEIEINVMDIECIGRRIENIETLAQKVAAWAKRRNEQLCLGSVPNPHLSVTCLAFP